jgi:hypothetical protein
MHLVVFELAEIFASIYCFSVFKLWRQDQLSLPVFIAVLEFTLILEAIVIHDLS